MAATSLPSVTAQGLILISLAESPRNADWPMLFLTAVLAAIAIIALVVAAATLYYQRETYRAVQYLKPNLRFRLPPEPKRRKHSVGPYTKTINITFFVENGASATCLTRLLVAKVDANQSHESLEDRHPEERAGMITEIDTGRQVPGLTYTMELTPNQVQWYSIDLDCSWAFGETGPIAGTFALLLEATPHLRVAAEIEVKQTSSSEVEWAIVWHSGVD